MTSVQFNCFFQILLLLHTLTCGLSASKAFLVRLLQQISIVLYVVRSCGVSLHKPGLVHLRQQSFQRRDMNLSVINWMAGKARIDSPFELGLVRSDIFGIDRDPVPVERPVATREGEGDVPLRGDLNIRSIRQRFITIKLNIHVRSSWTQLKSQDWN